MAVRIELWDDGVLVDGLEQWWDDVEAALDSTEEDLPILASISPYGEVTIPHDCLLDLADECRRLQPTSQERIQTVLSKIAQLSERAVTASDAELRFEGD